MSRAGYRARPIATDELDNNRTSPHADALLPRAMMVPVDVRSSGADSESSNIKQNGLKYEAFACEGRTQHPTRLAPH
jgi:hypothetical protein